MFIADLIRHFFIFLLEDEIYIEYIKFFVTNKKVKNKEVEVFHREPIEMKIPLKDYLYIV